MEKDFFEKILKGEITDLKTFLEKSLSASLEVNNKAGREYQLKTIQKQRNLVVSSHKNVIDADDETLTQFIHNVVDASNESIAFAREVYPKYKNNLDEIKKKLDAWKPDEKFKSIKVAANKMLNDIETELNRYEILSKKEYRDTSDLNKFRKDENELYQKTLKELDDKKDKINKSYDEYVEWEKEAKKYIKKII